MVVAFCVLRYYGVAFLTACLSLSMILSFLAALRYLTSLSTALEHGLPIFAIMIFVTIVFT